ncbi:MAG TPA: hypothetical protein VMA75_01850 [Candidatus Paceibacterota bacterium]|nr:hypothetical protein [Candidatus Paceibacterota bacterium]
MTALEYLKIRKRWEIVRIFAPILALVIALPVGLGGIFLALHRGQAPTERWFVAWAFCISVIGAVPFVLFQYLPRRIIERRHPEMNDLDEWQRLDLPVERYPAGGNDDALSVSDAESILWHAATTANGIFFIRDDLKEKRGKFAMGSPQRHCLDALFDCASRLADLHNRRYLDLHKLLIMKKGISTGRAYADAQKYRDTLQKNPF